MQIGRVLYVGAHIEQCCSVTVKLSLFVDEIRMGTCAKNFVVANNKLRERADVQHL